MSCILRGDAGERQCGRGSVHADPHRMGKASRVLEWRALKATKTAAEGGCFRLGYRNAVVMVINTRNIGVGSLQSHVLLRAILITLMDRTADHPYWYRARLTER